MAPFFLGPKFRFLAQKSDFCHTTPILVNDPFLALTMAVNFPPWERFFDFPFRCYSCFRKKIRLTAQKVFPLPTVGFYCTVSALALSARRPFGPARFVRGLDKSPNLTSELGNHLHFINTAIFITACTMVIFNSTVKNESLSEPLIRCAKNIFSSSPSNQMCQIP